MRERPTRYLQDRKYSRIASLTLFDLLIKLDLTKYNFPGSKERAKYHYVRKRFDFYILVFKRFINIVINDVIEKGIQFQFPKSSKGIGNLCIYRCVEDEYYKGIKTNDKFREFDPLVTNFSAYKLMFIGYTSKGETISREVYTDTPRRKKLVELVNSGKFKQRGVKDYDDYKEDVHKYYYDIDPDIVDRYLLAALKIFSEALLEGIDIYSFDPIKDGIFQIGLYYNDQKKFFKYVQKQLKKKIRYLKDALYYHWTDDFYILKPACFYLANKKKIANGEELNFGNLYLYPCYDLVLTKAREGDVIFKVRKEGVKYTYKHKIWVASYKESQYEVMDVLKKWDLDELALRIPKCQILHNHPAKLDIIKQNNILKYKETARKTRAEYRHRKFEIWEQGE